VSLARAVSVRVAVPGYRERFVRGALAEAGLGGVPLVVFEGERLDEVDLACWVLVAGGCARRRCFRRWWGGCRCLAGVHSFNAGVEGLLEHLPAGVVLTNSAGAYASPLAEYAVWGIATVRRRFLAALAGQRDRCWDWRVGAGGRELRGARVGVLGYGAIGRAVAHACHALGMHVSATRRTPLPSLEHEPIERLYAPDQLDQLLPSCDAVVVAASLNPSTAGMVGAAELALLQPHAILVNVARGALVDEDALVDALAAGRLGGAVLDVTRHEPLPADSPLWTLPNVIITPHTAGTTEQAYQRAAAIFAANLDRHLTGNTAHMANIVTRGEPTADAITG